MSVSTEPYIGYTYINKKEVQYYAQNYIVCTHFYEECHFNMVEFQVKWISNNLTANKKKQQLKKERY